MAFNPKLKSLAEALNQFSITYSEERMKLATNFAMPVVVLEEIQFLMENLDYQSSESALREYIISPYLRTAWKRYAADFLLWVERPLKYKTELSGMPDYVISRRSPRGKIFFEHPHIAVVEAKRDDFIGGWAQCALGMITAQKINGETDTNAVFGVVTNGERWEFGALKFNVFTKYSNSFSTELPDDLFNAICTIFEWSK